MFGMGGQEVIVILIIALIVFGPKKLPEVGRALGEGLRELRRASRGLTEPFELDEEEIHAAHTTETTQTKETTDNASDSDRRS